jgi:hypothetical protein
MKDIHNQLIKLAESWVQQNRFDADLARRLRNEAILKNHANYLANIPAYLKLAQEEGGTGNLDIDGIKNKLMFTDDIFKSYDQDWLDRQDYKRMTQWLSGLYYRRIDIETWGISSIDDWIKRLEA